MAYLSLIFQYNLCISLYWPFSRIADKKAIGLKLIRFYEKILGLTNSFGGRVYEKCKLKAPVPGKNISESSRQISLNIT